jgi:hypothetical protein
MRRFICNIHSETKTPAQGSSKMVYISGGNVSHLPTPAHILALAHKHIVVLGRNDCFLLLVCVARALLIVIW